MQQTKLAHTSGNRLRARAIAAALSLTFWGLGIPVSASIVPAPHAAPQDARIGDEHVFEEPLVATGPSSAEEQQALWQAVQQYRDAGNAEALAPLQAFLDEHPDSPWGLALRTNIGLTYYRLGYFSRAIEAWEAAWRNARAQTRPDTKRLADRALGELIRMHARIGHADRVDALLKEAEGRQLQGPATEAVAGAREGLWMMRNDPGVAYLCGPMAIKNILEFQGADKARIAKINAVRSGPRGVTLDTVGRLAQQVNLPYTVARRAPGTPIPLPAVVHWKINHYAAIVGEQNGTYHLKDPTFGRDLWVSKNALEAETSNYFLIPQQAAKQPGWKTVAQAEAKKVFGMGATTAVDDTRLTPNDVKACDCKDDAASYDPGVRLGTTAQDTPSLGMPTYNVHAMLVSLNLVDTPISYRPPKGPVINFTLTYNQRDAYQPANFTFFNFGPKWTSNWLAYIQDDPSNPGASTMRYVAGGGTVVQSGYNASTGSFSAEPADLSVLVRLSPTSYERRLGDGGKEVYAQPDGATYAPRRVFLTQIIDRHGNGVSLTYDSQQRLSTITDALGKRTTLSYDNPSAPLLVTQITDPFGRAAKVGYDASGRLTDIADAMGMRSSFSYDAGTFINAMTTPYGTTQFAYGENGMQRWINITDPLGRIERVEFAHQAPGADSSLAPLGQNVSADYLNYRNTFYWNAKTYAESPGDYTAARLYHWLHSKDNTNVTAGVLESTREPSEVRTWYKYAGQTFPTVTGGFEKPSSIIRQLNDTVAEVIRRSYNAQGNITSEIDPFGYQTLYEYADNGIDLIRVRHSNGITTDLRAEYSYDDKHNPLSYRNANGELTAYTYNPAGQKTSETNALGQVTRWEYDNDGFLQKIANAKGQTDRSFTYDAIGRVASMTDADGFVQRYQYDALNRLTQVQYPNNSTRTQSWDRLDLASVTDTLGNTTRYMHDGARNLVEETNSLGHRSQYEHYPDGKLKTVIAPNGSMISFTYTRSGRLASSTASTPTAASQTTTYTYDNAGRLIQVARPDGGSTTFQYDILSRMTSAIDSWGNSVQYTMDESSNRTGDAIKSTTGALARQVTRTFDLIGRPLSLTTGANSQSDPGTGGADPLIKVTPVSVTASSYYTDTYKPAMAIDGDLGSRWLSGNPYGWIEVDLGKPIVLRGIRMLTAIYPAGNAVYTITAGPDPAPTETWQTISGAREDTQWVAATPTGSPRPVRYVRINTSTDASWPAWREIEFYR